MQLIIAITKQYSAIELVRKEESFNNNIIVWDQTNARIYLFAMGIFF